MENLKNLRFISLFVANAYLENLNNKENVDHIDCDRLNNNVICNKWRAHIMIDGILDYLIILKTQNMLGKKKFMNYSVNIIMHVRKFK